MQSSSVQALIAAPRGLVLTLACSADAAEAYFDSGEAKSFQEE